MKDIFSSFEAVFLKFSAKRLAFWVTVAALFVGALFAYEALTGNFYAGALERRIALMKQLHELQQAGISSDPDLGPIYVDAVAGLRSQKVHRLADAGRLLTSGAGILTALRAKLGALSAGLPAAILLVLLGLWDERRHGRTDNARSIIRAGALVALVGAAIGLVLPGSWGAVTRVLLVSLGLFGFVAAVTAYGAVIRRRMDAERARVGRVL